MKVKVRLILDCAIDGRLMKSGEEVVMEESEYHEHYSRIARVVSRVKEEKEEPKAGKNKKEEDKR